MPPRVILVPIGLDGIPIDPKYSVPSGVALGNVMERALSSIERFCSNSACLRPSQAIDSISPTGIAVENSAFLCRSEVYVLPCRISSCHHRANRSRRLSGMTFIQETLLVSRSDTLGLLLSYLCADRFLYFSQNLIIFLEVNFSRLTSLSDLAFLVVKPRASLADDTVNHCQIEHITGP